MDITPTIPTDAQVIQSYGPDGFQISNRIYRHPVIVTPDRVIAWNMTDLERLTAIDFAALRQEEPPIEVILLGCGATGLLLPSPVRRDIGGMGFSIDAMSTGAACRTYNVMLSEGRRVAAAMVPVPRAARHLGLQRADACGERQAGGNLPGDVRSI